MRLSTDRFKQAEEYPDYKMAEREKRENQKTFPSVPEFSLSSQREWKAGWGDRPALSLAVARCELSTNLKLRALRLAVC